MRSVNCPPGWTSESAHKPEATRSALETLVAGPDSVRIAAAFVRQRTVDEFRLLQRPLRRLPVLAATISA